jgi:hypothetical protein
MKAGVLIAAPAHVRAPPVAKVTAKFALFRLSLLDQRGTIRRFVAVLPFIFNVAPPLWQLLFCRHFPHSPQNNSDIPPPGVPSRKPSTRVSRFKYAPRTQTNHYEATLKKAGKEVSASKLEISKDDKVATLTSKGVGADSKPTHAVPTFDK